MYRIRVLLYLSALSISTVLSDCPSDSIASSDGKTCFKPSAAKLPWDSASSVCQTVFGDLPTVNSAIDNVILNGIAEQTLMTDYIWLGYYWNGNQFVDSTGQLPKYTNWAAGEPSDITQTTGIALKVGSARWYASSGSLPAVCATPSNFCTNPVTPSPTLPTTTTTITVPLTTPIPVLQCQYRYQYQNKPCPENFVFFPQTCACYSVVRNVNIGLASLTCQQLAIGSDVASLHSVAEATFVADLVRSQDDEYGLKNNVFDNTYIALRFVNGQYIWWDGGSFDYRLLSPEYYPVYESALGYLVTSLPAGYSSFVQVDPALNTNVYMRYVACKKSLATP